MFGELPKLFDRDFVTGFFLPVALFLLGTLGLLAGYDLLTPLLSLVPQLPQLDLLLGTTLVGVASWFGAVILLLANRSLLRIVEGYGDLNPARLLHRFTRASYKRLVSRRDVLQTQVDAYQDSGQEAPRETLTKLNRVLTKVAEQYPDREDLVLSTMFGNILRSFEVYPRVMYGIGGVIGWNRLLAVVPDNFRQLINAAKAEMDFWVNLMILSALFIIEYISFAVYEWELKMLWLPLVAVFLAPFAYWRARSAAIEWGDMMKASFDVYLPDLSEKLRIAPQEGGTERRMWQQFSQAVLFRLPDRLPPRKQSTASQEDGEKDGIRFVLDNTGDPIAVLLTLDEWQKTQKTMRDSTRASANNADQPVSTEDGKTGKVQTTGKGGSSSNP
jgi:hypothetical protein